MAPSPLFRVAAWGGVLVFVVAAFSAFSRWRMGESFQTLSSYLLSLAPAFVLACIYSEQAKRLRRGEILRATVVNHYLDVKPGDPVFQDRPPRATLVYQYERAGEKHKDGYEMFQNEALKRFPIGTEFDVLWLPYEGTVPTHRLWAVECAHSATTTENRLKY